MAPIHTERKFEDEIVEAMTGPDGTYEFGDASSFDAGLALEEV